MSLCEFGVAFADGQFLLKKSTRAVKLAIDQPGTARWLRYSGTPSRQPGRECHHYQIHRDDENKSTLWEKTLLKPIEQIAIGDTVWGWDESLQETVARKVSRIFIKPNRPTFDVSYRRANDELEIVRGTEEHPFWVMGKGWTPLVQLRVGDLLQLADERHVTVDSVCATGNLEDVFNFEVDDVHNYFIGSSGVLVHNTSDRVAPNWILGAEGGLEPEQARASAQRIIDGHATTKHLKEFNDLGISKKGQLFRHAQKIIENPSLSGTVPPQLSNSNGRGGDRKFYYDTQSNTLVIVDARAHDGGTIFRPDPGQLERLPGYSALINTNAPPDSVESPSRSFPPDIALHSIHYPSDATLAPYFIGDTSNGYKVARLIANKIGENAYGFSTISNGDVVAELANKVLSADPASSVVIGSGIHRNSTGSFRFDHSGFWGGDTYHPSQVVEDLLAAAKIERQMTGHLHNRTQRAYVDVLDLRDSAQLAEYTSIESAAPKDGKVNAIRGYCFSALGDLPVSAEIQSVPRPLVPEPLRSRSVPEIESDGNPADTNASYAQGREPIVFGSVIGHGTTSMAARLARRIALAMALPAAGALAYSASTPTLPSEAISTPITPPRASYLDTIIPPTVAAAPAAVDFSSMQPKFDALLAMSDELSGGT